MPADLTLTPGRMYWLATVCKATVPTIYSVPLSSVDHLLGVDTTHLTVSYTYAQPPTRFPTGAVVATTVPPALAVVYGNPSAQTITRTLPCYAPVGDGLAMTGVRILRGSSLSKTPTDKPHVIVKALLRANGRASTLGTFDSRNVALTQGSPITLSSTMTNLPAGGKAAPSGECGINTSGGLIAKGHPIGATGIAMIGWCAWQLQGRAPAELQVRGARAAATFNIGGPICASLCTVLTPAS